MPWLAAMTFGAIAFAAATLAYVLTSSLADQPEYPPIMTDTLRFVGYVIVVVATLLGIVFVGYAFYYMP